MKKTKKEEQKYIEGISILDNILNDSESNVDKFVKDFIRPNGPTIYAFITNKVKDTYNDIYNTNLSFKRIVYLLKEKNKKTIEKLNKNIKIIIGEYKSIPENIKEPVYEGYISYFESPISKYLDWF